MIDKFCCIEAKARKKGSPCRSCLIMALPVGSYCGIELVDFGRVVVPRA